MKPEAIGLAYDIITHLWQREDFNRDNGIEAHKRAISFVENRGNTLDIGCGLTGRFIELLKNEGFEPEGVDISKEMLRLAKERHPSVNFYHQDICQWQLPKQYDLITAWDSIWHIPLKEQEAVITKLVAGLKSGGVFIFSFGGTEQACDHSDSTMGPEVYYSTLGTRGFIELLIKLGCQIRHLELDQHPELHAFMIVQKA